DEGVRRGTAVELEGGAALGSSIFSLSSRRGRRGLGRGGPFFLEFPSPRPSPHSCLVGRGRRSAFAALPNSMAVVTRGFSEVFVAGKACRPRRRAVRAR